MNTSGKKIYTQRAGCVMFNTFFSGLGKNIEIRIVGSRGNIELRPDNYDIREIITILQTAENLLFPTSKKDRPTISYSIEAGSIKHITKTSLQAVIGFNAIIGQIGSSNSVDFLEAQSARTSQESRYRLLFPHCY